MTYLSVSTSRGRALQVTREGDAERPRVGIYLRAGSPVAANARGEGLSIHLALLPALRAALEEAERDALEDGSLSTDDYARSGVALPSDHFNTDVTK